MVSGGAMRSTLPCRPPLPISTPLAGASSTRPPPRVRLAGAGSDQLDADHQPLAPHLGDRRPVGARSAAREQVSHRPWRRCPAGRGQQVAQVRERTGGRQRVAAEGRDRVRGEPVHQLGAGDDPGDGEPVAEALGEGQDVGLDPVGLDAPEVLAGAAPAGLDLVGDEQDAVLVADLLHRPEEPVGRVANPPTPWIGSAIRQATSPGGLGRDDVAQVVDAGCDEGVVVEVANGER
jgi:hypothetical protein